MQKIPFEKFSDLIHRHHYEALVSIFKYTTQDALCFPSHCFLLASSLCSISIVLSGKITKAKTITHQHWQLIGILIKQVISPWTYLHPFSSLGQRWTFPLLYSGNLVWEGILLCLQHLGLCFGAAPVTSVFKSDKEVMGHGLCPHQV
jgi:hypothetical protein